MYPSKLMSCLPAPTFESPVFPVCVQFVVFSFCSFVHGARRWLVTFLPLPFHVPLACLLSAFTCPISACLSFLCVCVSLRLSAVPCVLSVLFSPFNFLYFCFHRFLSLSARSRCNIHVKNGKVYMKHNSLGDDVPIVIILRAMGAMSDQEIVQLVRNSMCR